MEAARIKSAERRRIQWDEDNLNVNAEWLRNHPVTKHITEPDTPYVHDDGKFPSSEEEDTLDNTWTDAPYNHLASRVRHEQPHPARRTPSPPAEPQAAESKPPTLSISHQHHHGDVHPEEPSVSQEDFRLMRKAVYADEGKKFLQLKAALSATPVDDDEEEDS